MEFIYNAYRNMIKNILYYGYTITNYHDYTHYTNPCILRHDVDLDLEKAAMFAELEKDISEEVGQTVTSTYFILITSDMYNVLSSNNMKQIFRIIDAGGEIGLHFDETVWGKDLELNQIKQLIEKECKILEMMTGQNIKAVSMHIPSKNLLEADLNLGPIINSYSNKFLHDFKYVSDSSMHWREDVDSIIKSKKAKSLHILTHPIWYNHHEQRKDVILNEFVERFDKLRNEEINKHKV